MFHILIDCFNKVVFGLNIGLKSEDAVFTQHPRLFVNIYINFAVNDYDTFAPNGAKESFANLKHCLPKGIPIIVMHQSAPITANAIPWKRPPKIM